VQIRVILINHLHNFLPLIEDSRAHWRFSQFPCTKLISLFQWVLSAGRLQSTASSKLQVQNVRVLLSQHPYLLVCIQDSLNFCPESRVGQTKCPVPTAPDVRALMCKLQHTQTVLKCSMVLTAPCSQGSKAHSPMPRPWFCIVE
jgi:hypothetical protein